MNHYRHSAVFATLKDTTESIKKNYTSSQYIQVLDSLIYKAIEQILETTNLGDVFISSLMVWYSESSKRRISAIKKPRLQLLFLMFLKAETPKEKLKWLKRCRLERNLLYQLIESYLSYAKVLNSLLFNLIRDDTPSDRILIARMLKAIQSIPDSSTDIFCSLNSVQFWYDGASRFKGQLLEKYTRLVAVQAQQAYVELNFTVQLDDLLQNFMVAAAKAIDKYDLNKGALTSYIKIWLKAARTTSFIENSGMQNQEHFVPLDESETTDTDNPHERKQTIDHVRQIAKLLDPSGVGRFQLGLEEVLNRKEERALNDTIYRSL